MQIIPSLILSLFGSTLFIPGYYFANKSNIEHSNLKNNLGCEFEFASNTKFALKNTYFNKQARFNQSTSKNNYFFDDSSIQVDNDILPNAINTNSSLSNKSIASEMINCF